MEIFKIYQKDSKAVSETISIIKNSFQSWSLTITLSRLHFDGLIERQSIKKMYIFIIVYSKSTYNIYVSLKEISHFETSVGLFACMLFNQPK